MVAGPGLNLWRGGLAVLSNTRCKTSKMQILRCTLLCRAGFRLAAQGATHTAPLTWASAVVQVCWLLAISNNWPFGHGGPVNCIAKD